MLNDELSTAKQIKKTANRNAVQSAIKATLEKLKLYKRTPANGLLIFCGLVQGESGKESKMTVALEPFRPITRSLYHCDSLFDTQPLHELLQADDKFGFMVMDGRGCLFASVCGNNREVLHKFSVELPKKHGRGGQSALRFARLRLEKRHNYLRKVAELARSLFIEDDKVNCVGLILAGSADLKSELNSSDLFDPRLHQKILSIFDVAYGGMNGLNQAIELASPVLSNVQLVRERQLLQTYFEEIACDSGKYCFGINDTMLAIESQGAAQTVLCSNDLETFRVVLRDLETDVETIAYQNPDDLAATLQNTNVELIDKQTLIEWFCDNCKTNGIQLEFVTDRSAEGAQFCRGFGGLGALLRYQVDFSQMAAQAEDDLDFDMDSEEYFV